jgi:hypothetical protein
MEGHEERLRRIEEKLDQLLECEGSLDNGQQDSGGHERELDDGQADAHGADLALSVRGGQPGTTGCTCAVPRSPTTEKVLLSRFAGGSPREKEKSSRRSRAVTE